MLIKFLPEGILIFDSESQKIKLANKACLQLLSEESRECISYNEHQTDKNSESTNEIKRNNAKYIQDIIEDTIIKEITIKEN